MSDKRYTKAKRKQVIEDWRKTGDPLCRVAKRCGVGVGAAYYWAKQEGSCRGKGSAMQEVKFAQLVRATAEFAPTLEVKIGRAAIRVAKDFDPELVRRLVEALDGGQTDDPSRHSDLRGAAARGYATGLRATWWTSP